MKKIVSVLLSIMILFAFPIAVYAEEGNQTTTTSVEYFDDGSYMVTIIEEEPALTRASTKSGSKTKSYYDSDDELQWVAKLSGTFSYTGSSATCTKSSVTYTIYGSNWKATDSEATKSGRTATGKFTFKKYLTFVPMFTQNITLTLSCSNSGTLS